MIARGRTTCYTGSMHKRFSHGFTIVELLVVIVVLAILAAITYFAYSTYVDRTRATSVMANLENLDKSFRQWAVEERMYTWQKQNIPADGLAIDTMRTQFPVLGRYINESPKVDGVQSEDWFYDNDGDVKTICGLNYNGVNIVIRFVKNQKVAQMVDDTMDDGDLNCGKVRFQDERIFYSLSYTQETGI